MEECEAIGYRWNGQGLTPDKGVKKNLFYSSPAPE